MFNMMSVEEYGLFQYDNKFQMKPRRYVFPFDFFFLTLLPSSLNPFCYR